MNNARYYKFYYKVFIIYCVTNEKKVIYIFIYYIFEIY